MNYSGPPRPFQNECDMKLVTQILNMLLLLSVFPVNSFAAAKLKTICSFVSKDGKVRRTTAKIRLTSDQGRFIIHNGKKSFLVPLVTNNDIVNSCRVAITSHNYGSSASMMTGIKIRKNLISSYSVVYNLSGIESEGKISNATNSFLAHGILEARNKIFDHISYSPNSLRTIKSSELASSEIEEYLGLKKRESGNDYDLSNLLPYAVASDLAYKFEKRIGKNIASSFDEQVLSHQYKRVIKEFHRNFVERFQVILFEKQTPFNTASVAFYDVETKELIIAYKGTKPSFFMDIFADLGITSYFNDLHKITALESYKSSALSFYSKAVLRAEERGYELSEKVVTGHSLGGFLATYVTVRKNADFAKVFSAPGIHDIFDKVSRTKNVLNIYIDTDPVVEYTGLTTPHVENLLIFPYIKKGAFSNHKLGNIIGYLNSGSALPRLKLNHEVERLFGEENLWVETDSDCSLTDSESDISENDSDPYLDDLVEDIAAW